jgi:hypothetical protein
VSGTGSGLHLVVGYDVGIIDLWVIFLKSQFFNLWGVLLQEFIYATLC